MKVHPAQSLTMTVTLVASVAFAGTAFATETTLAKAAAPSLGIPEAMALALPQPPPPAPEADGMRWTADVRRLFTDKRPAPDCTKPCDSGNKGPLIADRLLTELGEDPLLGTVMAPVTRGVPISTGDGGAALKLAVIPTQITRGSGVVAIGHF